MPYSQLHSYGKVHSYGESFPRQITNNQVYSFSNVLHNYLNERGGNRTQPPTKFTFNQ